LDILQNDEVVGNLKVSIKRDESMDIDGINVPVLSIYAETKAKNEEFEIFQSIESKVTADLNLIKETKIENTQLLTKSITTEYHQGHGKLTIYVLNFYGSCPGLQKDPKSFVDFFNKFNESIRDHKKSFRFFRIIRPLHYHFPGAQESIAPKRFSKFDREHAFSS